MKTIMIDQDEVITEGGFLYAINSFLGTNYVKEDFKEFYMQDVVPKEKQKEFFDYLIKINIYNHCYMLDGAKEVIEELNRFYQVYIGTSYLIKEIPYESGQILVQKHNYFMDNLPFLNPKQFIFIYDKKLLNIDIKIDDKIDNLENAKMKLLFSNYHNLDMTKEELDRIGVTRVDNWNDVKVKLLKK